MDINLFWKSVISQNETSLRTYFHKNALIKWHCTNELFSVEEYIKANCHYPGNWSGEIKKVYKIEDTIILVGEVFSLESNSSNSNYVVSFIKLKDNLIIEMDEYWSSDTSIPHWRKLMKLGNPIL